MFSTIKAYALQIALGVMVLLCAYLGVRLVSAEMEISHMEAAAAKAAAKFTSYVAETATLTSQANQKNRDLEWKLAKQGHDADKEKQDALENLAAEYQSVIDGLHKRPSRPAATGPAGAVPTAAGSAAAEQGCGREQLYREDAEVVVGLARAAADLRVELLDLRSRYEAAQRAIDAANTTVAQ